MLVYIEKQKMKAKFLLGITILLSVWSTIKINAQSKTSFEIEGDFGLPTKSQYATVLGGTLKVRRQLSEKVSVALSAGVHHFFTNESAAISSVENDLGNYWDAAYTVIPIRAELRYNVNNGWFVQGKAGVMPALDERTKFTWSAGIGKMWNNRWGVSVNYDDFGFKINKFVGASIFYSPRFKRYKYNNMNLEKSDAWSVYAYGMFGTGLGETAGTYGNFGLQFANRLNHQLEIVADASYLSVGKSSDNYMVFYMSNMLVAKLGLRYQFYKSLFVGGHVGVGFELPGFANLNGALEVGTRVNNKLLISAQLDKYQRYSAPLLGAKIAYKL